MANYIDVSQGLSIKDLLEKNEVLLNFENEFITENEDEHYDYDDRVDFSKDEMLKYLNMNDSDDSCDDEFDEAQAVLPCSVSFEKIKTDMEDILGNGKIMKLVKRKGVGKVIPNNSQVTFNYVGYIELNDEPFDSTYAHGKPNVVCLNQGLLIPGLECAICSMQKHEISVFIVHPDLAYGAFGCPPRIMPNVEVMFAIHLIDYIDNGTAITYSTLNPEEKKSFPVVLKRVKDMINTANYSFKQLKIKKAIREYRRAVAWLENVGLQNEEEEEEYKRLVSRANNNLAVCFNKINMPRSACLACNAVPNKNAKTFYHHGIALHDIGEFNEAMKKLQKALKLEPRNSKIIDEIQKLNERQRKYADMEKRLWRNCFASNDNKEKNFTNSKEAIEEMIEIFVKDDRQLRLPLPDGLTISEDEYVRECAAKAGLSITTHSLHGKDILYLSKPKY